MLVFKPTDLQDVFIIEPDPIVDDRGSFARTYCRREFSEHGLDFIPVQSSISYNRRRGTLRGLHYRAPPRSEAKLVRCTAGAAYDVAVDIRPDSSTFGTWIATELTAINRKSLFIPQGFGHGFQTLVDGTEMLYLMSDFYDPDSQRGIRWDDPLLEIDWPVTDHRVVSERDRSLPYLVSSHSP